MGVYGPPPKPAHQRRRTNKKPEGLIPPPLEAPEAPDVPEMPNPDERVWHPLTVEAWQHAWRSPMSTQWLETDADVLGRLAILWDDFYKAPGATALAEIRLQEQRFGLSPLDRRRMEWVVSPGAEVKRKLLPARPEGRRSGADPRLVLQAVK